MVQELIIVFQRGILCDPFYDRDSSVDRSKSGGPAVFEVRDKTIETPKEPWIFNFTAVWIRERVNNCTCLIFDQRSLGKSGVVLYFHLLEECENWLALNAFTNCTAVWIGK